MKRIVVCLVISFVLAHESSFADVAMQLQLPFVDGARYECVQNSDDGPSHGRDENYNVVNSTATLFDLDFGLGVGTIITAAANGEVSWGSNPGGFGNYLKVDHGNGFFTLYAHLMNNGYIAKNGQKAVAGQPIGFSGNTGYSTGPHIHFGVHKGSNAGESVRMDVKAKEYSSGGSFKGEGFFSTGLQNERELYCKNENGSGNRGNFYEAIPLSGVFNQFQCHKLDKDYGILCWHGYDGHFAFCEDGTGHIRYYKTGGGFRSESVVVTYYNVNQLCYPTNTERINLYAYLNGNSVGVGGSATGRLPTDPPPPHLLPDFIVRKVILTDKDGKEKYEFYPGERIQMVATIENIGPGDPDKTIEIHFYRSGGYKEDDHGDWARVGTDFIKSENIRSGDTKTEEEGMDAPLEPGIFNIVVCADHPKNDHNQGGAVEEEHESNNCSTEAVFEVKGEPPPLIVRTITVTSPNSGDKWRTDKEYYIKWNSENVPKDTHVKIEFSLDNGSSWTSIDNYAANDGSKRWKPGSFKQIKKDTDKARVRVSSADFSGVSGTSDKFKIDHKK
jgi:murein DD-endopeptidase MepM/ murein hydrolase activator NlpD